LVSLTFAGPAQVIQAGTWAVGELAGSAVRTVGQPATATAQRAVVRLIVVARPARLIVVARPARLVRVVRALVASHRPWLRHLVGGPALIGVVRPLPAEADLLVGIAAILLLLLGIAAPDRARAAGRTGQLWPGSRAPPVPVG
jgi:hypothetical protein